MLTVKLCQKLGRGIARVRSHVSFGYSRYKAHIMSRSMIEPYQRVVHDLTSGKVVSYLEVTCMRCMVKFVGMDDYRKHDCPSARFRSEMDNLLIYESPFVTIHKIAQNLSEHKE